MAADLASVLGAYREFQQPRAGGSSNPFILACTIADPASDEEISAAWDRVALPPQLADLWRTSREARLFEDVDYGQWGLALLAQAAARARTSGSLEARPRDFEQTDVVLGEFLGDSGLLIVTRGRCTDCFAPG